MFERKKEQDFVIQGIVAAVGKGTKASLEANPSKLQLRRRRADLGHVAEEKEMK
jgi:hypothetical protein